MKTVIHPRIQRSMLTLLDNITYSHAKQPDGSVLDLKLSILLHHGNQELRLASGLTTDVPPDPLPVIIWVPGGAWRGTDKNQSIAEMQFLAERGFALVSMYYRSSAQAHYPAQLIDVKTAVRFLRAHAEQYHIDPHRIGMIGRSAGGYLASMAAESTAAAAAGTASKKATRARCSAARRRPCPSERMRQAPFIISTMRCVPSPFSTEIRIRSFRSKSARIFMTPWYLRVWKIGRNFMKSPAPDTVPASSFRTAPNS